MSAAFAGKKNAVTAHAESARRCAQSTHRAASQRLRAVRRACAGAPPGLKRSSLFGPETGVFLWRGFTPSGHREPWSGEKSWVVATAAGRCDFSPPSPLLARSLVSQHGRLDARPWNSDGSLYSRRQERATTEAVNLPEEMKQCAKRNSAAEQRKEDLPALEPATTTMTPCEVAGINRRRQDEWTRVAEWGRPPSRAVCALAFVHGDAPRLQRRRAI